MDLQTIIIGLVATALCVLPILYLQSIRKKEKGKLLQSFLAVAAQRQLQLSTSEMWDPFFAIGIDLQKMQLIYLSDCTYSESTIQLDLTTIEKCTVEKLSSQANGNLVIEAIALKIRYRDAAKFKESTLVFYQKEMSLNLRDELQLAEKWQKIIESTLKTIPPAEAVKRVPVLA